MAIFVYRRSEGASPVNGRLIIADPSCIVRLSCGGFVVPQYAILCRRGGGGGGAYDDDIVVSPCAKG